MKTEEPGGMQPQVKEGLGPVEPGEARKGPSLELVGQWTLPTP